MASVGSRQRPGFQRSRSRTQRLVLPSREAAKATRRPSGETAGMSPSNVISSGGNTDTLSTRGSSTGRVARQSSAPTTIKISPSTAAAVQPSRDGDGVTPDSGALPIHSSSSFKSRADCQRLSGSFSRLCFSTRSSAGGEHPLPMARGVPESLRSRWPVSSRRKRACLSAFRAALSRTKRCRSAGRPLAH